ncbi:MAG: T9SS type A sorting domain-containing protein [Flavobacteriales bacterium]|nr:T9SS type A sorting domain-containing protein [Flavobacteriales bacterium]
MRKILLGLALISGTTTFAQSVTPEVTATAGAHFAIPGYQMSWTLGEPITQTLSNSSGQLTQGFQQSNISVIGINDYDFSYEIEVFPNPTIDIVQVKLSDGVKEGRISIIDPTGKRIYENEIVSDHFMLDFAPYAQGTYFLNFSSSNGELQHTIRLQKLK